MSLRAKEAQVNSLCYIHQLIFRLYYKSDPFGADNTASRLLHKSVHSLLLLALFGAVFFQIS